mmetsp:Transcript_44268/g.126748  ORF Transcript_44268/g.126748 Transcript_44268/m.126748 type:complete len:561 (-) Transcript_44268:71-1753(-)
MYTSDGLELLKAAMESTGSRSVDGSVNASTSTTAEGVWWSYEVQSLSQRFGAALTRHVARPGGGALVDIDLSESLGAAWSSVALVALVPAGYPWRAKPTVTVVDRRGALARERLVQLSQCVVDALARAAAAGGPAVFFAAERAAAMLPKYAGADLDTKDHVLIFRVFAALGDVDAAEAAFRRLGGRASSMMLNLLLLACAKAGQPERAALVIRDAHGLEKGQEERIVDVVSYNTAIKGFAQAGSVHGCFKCFHAMIEHGLEPDGITFSTLLDACVEHSSVGSTRSIVDALIAGGKERASTVCMLFLKTLVRASRLAKALELYDDMKASGVACADIATYSVLIKALVDQHDLEKALQLLEDLKAAGLSPDDIILTHLLEGCRHAGDHATGKRLFAEMVGSCVKPSEFTLVTMLKLHGRCGAHGEAHDLVAGWKDQHGSAPTVIHYTCLVSGCMRTRSYDQAWKAYQLMRSNGVAPDVTSLSTLLPGMAAAQRWDRVCEAAEAALLSTPPLKVPAEILNNALSQMVAAKESKGQTERLRGLMTNAGVTLSAPRTARPWRHAS